MSSRKDRDELYLEIEEQFRHDLPVHLYAAHLHHRIDPTWPPNRWTAWPLSRERVPDPRTSVLYGDNAVPSGFFAEDVDEMNRDNDEDGDGNNGDNENSDGFSNHGTGGGTTGNNGDLDSGSDSGSDSESDSDSESIIWGLSDDENEGKSEGVSEERLRLVQYKETLSNSRNDLLNELSALVRSRVVSRGRELSKSVTCPELSAVVPDEFVMEATKSVANTVDQIITTLIAMQQRRDVPKTLLDWQDVVLAVSRTGVSRQLGVTAEKYNGLQGYYRRCKQLFEDSSNSYKYAFEDGSVLSGQEAVEKYYAELDTDSERVQFEEAKRKAWHFNNIKTHLIRKGIQLEDQNRALSFTKSAETDGRKRVRIPALDTDISAMKRTVLDHGGFRLDEDEYVVRLKE